MSDSTTALKLGQIVPDFELTTFDPTKGDFGKFSLRDQVARGRWSILFFYPADFTFVCATEFAALAEQQKQFELMGCDIVTVSTDTEFSHLAWQRSERSLAEVKYQMGADPTGKVSRLFGVYDDSTGLDLRGTFMINPEGRLLTMEMNFYNLGRNIDELMRKLKANLYMGEYTNEVCPAKWKDEGDKTLVNPGANMVGKVHEALTS